MSLWKIAWRSIQQRALASSLTALSMALGVALVVAVIVIHGVVEQSFRRGAQGYDLIVGAKGSPLELVLSTVYHLGKPPATMPYSVYDELVNGTDFSSDVETAIPLCLGDNFKGFRVIGTVPDMFDRLEYLDGRKYEFAQGRNFHSDAPFEAVIGATAARKTGLTVGEKFKPVHGSAAERGEEHSPFDVVGVLAQTGTPNDRAIFVNMEGFYHLHTASDENADQGTAAAHGEKKTEAKADAKSAAKKEPAGHAKTGEKKEAHAAHGHDEIPDDKKQVTAVLVGINPNMIATRRVALPKFMSKTLEVQAVAPSEQIDRLLVGIVGNIQLILLILAVMIVIVAGIGIMVSIYNSMSDRRHEIAVIRALGARRSTVMVVVLLESILLALGGGAIGLLLGHGLTGLLAPLIADQTGVSVNPLQFQLSELILIPGLIVLASMVGYLPAVVAYKTDVAQSLISSP
jgi:putative ABC transport system permease protein